MFRTVSQDTQKRLRAAMIIMSEARDYGEKKNFDFSVKNLKNMELMFRSTAALLSQALSEVMSERSFKKWQKEVKELDLDWSV